MGPSTQLGFWPRLNNRAYAHNIQRQLYRTVPLPRGKSSRGRDIADQGPRTDGLGASYAGQLPGTPVFGGGARSPPPHTPAQV